MTTARSLNALEQRARKKKRRVVPQIDPPLNIIDFATNRRFCNYSLYPAQATLLKVLTAALHLLTGFDACASPRGPAGSS